MKQLKYNCRRSKIGVSPANWRTTSSVRKDWFIYYRFYDDNLKEKKLVAERGMNAYKTAQERRSYVLTIVALLEKELDQLHYNPITGYIEKEEEKQATIIDKATPFVEALKFVYEKRKAAKAGTYSESLLNCLKWVRQATEKAAKAIHLHDTPVCEISRRHIKAVLDEIGRVKGETWTANNFNYHRTHLSILFSDLDEWEVIVANPVDKIRKMKVPKKTRVTLTMDQRKLLYVKLKVDNYNLWRYMILFYSSGARITEFAGLKRSDIDLKERKATYTVGKRNNMRIERPLKDNVLELWQQICAEAGPDQYLFSRHLKPGDAQIQRFRFTAYWKKYVKDAFGIDADLYSLKHSHTTEITELASNVIAARLAGHANTAMVDAVYDVGKDSREFQIIRQAGNSFA